MTPALVVLLCLVRLEDGEGSPWSGRDPAPAPSLALLPGDPRLRSPGEERTCAGAGANLSQGALLQGCAGPRTQGQAGECAPTVPGPRHGTGPPRAAGVGTVALSGEEGVWEGPGLRGDVVLGPSLWFPSRDPPQTQPLG